MKLKLDETLFADNDSFERHYNKHVAKNYKDYIFDDSDELIEPMSKQEYNEVGDALSKQVVKTSDFNSKDRYVGFVNKDGEIIKLDKILGELVIYACRSPKDCNTITLYRIAPSRIEKRYNKLKQNYKREITSNDDKYNR